MDRSYIVSLTILLIVLTVLSIAYVLVTPYLVEKTGTGEKQVESRGKREYSLSMLPSGFARATNRENLVGLLEKTIELGSLLSNLRISYYIQPIAITAGASSKETVYSVTTGTSSGSLENKWFSHTNVLVEGIDEADIVKTDGRYVYVVKHRYETDREVSKIIVIDAANPKNLSIVLNISIPDILVTGIYVYGDKVVAIGSENLYRALAVKGENSVRVYSLVPKTYIIILELVGSNCQVLDIRVIDGDYVDSRLYNGTLYLVTSLGIATSGLKPYIPRVNGVEVSYDKILVASNEYPDTYSIIYALNLDTMEDNETVFVHNHASRIYMSYTSIYLIGYVIDYSWLFNRLADIIDNESVKEVIRDIMESSKPLIEKIAMVYDIIEDYLREKGYTVRVWINDKLETIKVNDTVEIAILPYTPWRVSWNTSIHRFIYQGLYIEYIGSVSLPGRILDPYSIDEYNGTLRIALHNDDSDDNSLYVLDIDSMEVVGYVTGIGEGMDIYAARYIGDKAYLVTYRRTDPLYVIDLSDPENPVVLGKLVMPGYSDYLHPLTNTLLLGIGVDDNGYIKVQVYNVSNPLQPVIVSSLTLGSGYTSVLHEYKAFTINTRDKYFIIPYNGYTRFKNNGFYVIAYSLNGSLTVKGFIGIDRPTRSVFIEDIVYCIGSSSVVSVNATTMEILDTIEID